MQINVGSGNDVTIRELAAKIAQQAQYGGKVAWDSTRPDGMPRKCMDVSKLSGLGFAPSITLDQGIAQMIRDYRAQKAQGVFS